MITFAEFLTPENINMAFNIAFFVIIGLVAVGFLVGLIRGVWKSGFRLLIVGGLVIGVFIGTRPIVDMLANLDVGQLIGSINPAFTSFSFSISDSATISVNVTTLKETIESVVSQLVTALNISSGDAEAALEIINAFTMVFLRYVVFIILSFLVITVGELLAGILYFFPLRLIIPKSWRKKHKLRLVGGLLNAVKVVLVGAMLIVPFSSIINTINMAFQKDENAASDLDDPTYLQIMSFLNAYNDSLLAQTLFNWSVDENGRTLDVQLMEYITQEKIGEYNLSLTGELAVLAGIGKSVLSSGFLNNSIELSVKINALMTEDMVASIITNLASSSLLLGVIPMAVQFAMNMEEVKSFVDPEKLNMDNVSWQDELLNIRDIAVDVIQSGVIPSIMELDTPDPLSIIPMLVSDGAYNGIHSALLRIDNSEFLSQVVPAVLYQLTQNEIETGLEEGQIGLSTFLPSDWNEFKEIKLGAELALVYDVFTQLADIDPDLIPTIMGMFTGTEEEPSPAKKGKKDGAASAPRVLNASTDAIIDIVKEHIDEIIEVFVGKLDDDGDPTGIDPETGKTVVKDGEGNPLPNVHSNLLDSELLVRGLDSLMRFTLTPSLTTLMGEGADLTSLDDAFDILNGDSMKDRRVNYKSEFGSILGIFGVFFTDDDLAAIRDLLMPSEEESEPLGKKGHPLRADDPENLFNIFDDVNVRKAFKTKICPRLDKSVLMGKVIPSLLETLVTDNAADFTDQIGLDVGDLNFEFTDVGTQMAIMIDLIGYASSIMQNIDTIFDDMSPHVNNLIGMLDSLWMSDIINPKNESDHPTSDNYFKIYDKIFGLIESIGVSSGDLETAYDKVSFDGWTTEFDEDGNVVGLPGENYNLIKFLETVLTSGLLDLDSEGGNLMGQMKSLVDDPDDPIGKIFTSVDSSIIISDIFGGVLDNFFGDTGGLIDPELGTSFKNVENWSMEGENLKQLVTDLDEFVDDINDIDFLNSDADKVGNVLKSMAKSQIFDVGDSYKFGAFLKNKFISDASIGGDLFYDPDETGASPSPYDLFEADIDSVGSTQATKENWYGDDGEIDKIVGFLAELNDFSGGSADIFGDLTGDPNLSLDGLRDVLLALNEVTSFRIMIYNIYAKIFSTEQFAIGGLDMNDSNYFIMSQIDKAGRAEEINATFDVYDNITTLGLNGSGGEFDISAISDGNIEKIETMLNILHDAKLFNTFDVQHLKSRANGDYTVFEQTVRMIYHTSTIDTYIYDGMTPAEMADALDEDIVGIDNNLTDDLADDGWIGNDGEIKAIGNIFKAFKNTALSFEDFSGGGAENVISGLFDTPAGLDDITNLFKKLNGSAIAYPAVPNLFDKVLTAGDVGVGGIDLSKAHTHYRGNRGDQNADDKYKPYEDGEITNIIEIISEVKEIAGEDYSDLQNVGNAAINNFQNVIVHMSETNIFHIAGSSTGDPDDATVFEQMMIKLMDDSGMSALINDPDNPNPNYYDIGNNYKFLTDHEKADYLVVNFETLYAADVRYYTHTWEDEIVSFFRNIKEMKRLGLTNGSGFSPTTLSPENLSFMLGAMNYSNLTSDAVPDLIKTAFVNIKFDTFSEGKENYYLYPTGLMATDLSTIDYDTFTIDNQGLIEQLLADFYTIGVGYDDMGSFNFVDFLDTHSSFAFLDFMKRSGIYGNTVTGKTYKTRSLVFHNFIDPLSMSVYINRDNPAADKTSRTERIDDIFETDFDVAYEAASLDGFLSILDGLKGNADASSISGLGTQFQDIIESTYTANIGGDITDRAYLVSELAAGFYTDIFEDEYAKVLIDTPVFIDFYENDYGNLNPMEALGAHGSLSVLGEIAAMIPDMPNPQEENIENLKTYFQEMGSLVNTGVTGGPHPAVYDYSSWDEDGNSLIARLFFSAEVITNASWGNFKSAVNTASLINHGSGLILQDNPYATDFVFEILGQQIAYAFNF